MQPVIGVEEDVRDEQVGRGGQEDPSRLDEVVADRQKGNRVDSFAKFFRTLDIRLDDEHPFG